MRRAAINHASRLWLLLVVAAILVATAALLHGCAHTGAVVVSCAERVTPELEELAAGALVGDNYDAAIARDFAGLTACIVIGAVEAAIDGARNLKLAGRVSDPSAQTAIEAHGKAWLAAHRRPP